MSWNVEPRDAQAIAGLLRITDPSSAQFHFYPAMGRVVAVVSDAETLSLALENVRNASRHSGWDVEVMAHDDFEERSIWFRRAVAALDGVNERLADKLISEGFRSFDDLSIIDPEDLCLFGHFSLEAAHRIIEQADAAGGPAQD
jgi:transcription termination/antitermination protein NusA